MLNRAWLRSLVVLTVLAVIAVQGQLVAFANPGLPQVPDQGIGLGVGAGQGNGNAKDKDAKDDNEKAEGAGNSNGHGNANGNGPGNGQGQGNGNGNGNDAKDKEKDEAKDKGDKDKEEGLGDPNTPDLPPVLEQEAFRPGTPASEAGHPGNAPATPPGRANENIAAPAGLLPPIANPGGGASNGGTSSNAPASPAVPNTPGNPRSDTMGRGAEAKPEAPPGLAMAVPSRPSIVPEPSDAFGGLGELMRGVPAMSEERSNNIERPPVVAVTESLMSLVGNVPGVREEVPAPPARVLAAEALPARHIATSGFDPALFSGFDESLFAPAFVVSSPTPSRVEVSQHPAAPVVMASILEETRSYAGFAPARFSGIDDVVLSELAQGRQQGQSQRLTPAGEQDEGSDDAPPAQAKIVELARERAPFAGFDPGLFGGFSLDLFAKQGRLANQGGGPLQ